MASSANQAELSEHRRKHRQRQAYQDYDRRLAAARGASNRRDEVVNKIASIDIWATERLYKKWQRHALEERHRHRSRPSPDQNKPMFNYNATQQSGFKQYRDRDSGKYIVASMAKPINNKRIRTAKVADLDSIWTGDELRPHQHRCQNRRRAQSRPDETRQKQQFRHSSKPRHECQSELSRHSRRHLSLTNSLEQPQAHCQCAKLQKQKAECQSERTSEIDWPDSWPSIWGSSVPQCMQHVSSNSERPVAPERSANNRRQERSKEKRLRHCHQSVGRCDAVKHPKTGKDTVEALLTLAPNKIDDANIAGLHMVGRKDNRGSSQSSAMRHTTNLQNNRSTTEKPLPMSQSFALDAFTILQKVPSKLDEKQPIANIASYDNACKEDALGSEFNVARLVKTECCQFEQARSLPKPVVWLIADEPPAPDQRIGSDKDSANLNNEGHVKEAADNRQFFNVTYGSIDVVSKKRTVVSSAVSHPLQQQVVSRSFANNTIACHNSAESRLLKMLSTATETTEREEEEKVQSHMGGPMGAAQISYIKSTAFYRITGSLKPEMRMHSNTASNKSISSDGESQDGDGIIHTVQEFGESRSVEPQTGIVTRLVQVEVLRAAELMAAKGFAGLIGARPSEMGARTNTDTVNSTDDDDDFDLGEDFNTEGDRDSLGELDDDDKVEFNEPNYSKVKSSPETPSDSSPSTSTSSSDDGGLDSRLSSGRRQQQGRSRANIKGDYEQMKGYSRQQQQVAAVTQTERRMLPMTQCPTTRHRIECFKTSCGQVKCYMTARHPVKCRVEDGRIVCKATVNAEPSSLPYPCNADWQ